MEPLPAGSQHRPYRLAIIGGGPSGCSVIVRAIRLGVINELCSGSPHEAGVCLLDKDSTERFGGGRLQDYVINSNTFAAKFATNVMNEKIEVDPPERTFGTPLMSLENMPSKLAVEGYGNSHLPLNVAGNFLRDVGSVVLDTLGQYPSCRCSTGINVLGLQRVVVEPHSMSPSKANNSPKKGDITLSVLSSRDLSPKIVWKIEFTSSSTDSSAASSSQTSNVEFIYAKTVVLATGGRQDIPRLPSNQYLHKCLTSDHVCTAVGAAELKERLLAAGNCNRPGRVIIVGGSHSAFSAIWICLNKVQQTLPPNVVKVINPTDTNACAPAASNATSAGVSTTANKSDDLASKLDATGRCTAPMPGSITFGSSSIVVMHRSPIKVFYSMKKEADADNYFDIGQINKVTGQIHPFGGLRGDAKELFRQIKAGKETRVRLMSVKTNGQANSIVNKLYEEAAVIIWACGYNTNQPIVKDLDESVIPLRQFRGQVEVDDNANILTDKVLLQAPAIIPVSPSRVATPAAGTDTSPLRVSVPAAPLTPNGRFSPAPPPTTPGSPSRRDRPPTTPIALTSGLIVASPAPTPLPQSASAGISTSTNTSNGTVPAVAAMSPSVLKVAAPPYRVGSLLGSGLGYGFKATFENGEPDGSSGRADGVAVYLKRGATLVLASVLGPRVFGQGVRSWDERTAIINNTRKAMFQQAAAEAKQSIMVTVPASPSAASSKQTIPDSPVTSGSAQKKSGGSNVQASTSNGHCNPKASPSHVGAARASAASRKGITYAAAVTAGSGTSTTPASIAKLTNAMDAMSKGIDSLLESTRALTPTKSGSNPSTSIVSTPKSPLERQLDVPFVPSPVHISEDSFFQSPTKALSPTKATASGQTESPNAQALSPRSAAMQAKRVDDVVERLTRPRRSQSLSQGSVDSVANNQPAKSVPTAQSNKSSPRWQQQNGKTVPTYAECVSGSASTNPRTTSSDNANDNNSVTSRSGSDSRRGSRGSITQTKPSTTTQQPKGNVASGAAVKYAKYTQHHGAQGQRVKADIKSSTGLSASLDVESSAGKSKSVSPPNRDPNQCLSVQGSLAGSLNSSNEIRSSNNNAIAIVDRGASAPLSQSASPQLFPALGWEQSSQGGAAPSSSPSRILNVTSTLVVSPVKLDGRTISQSMERSPIESKLASPSHVLSPSIKGKAFHTNEFPAQNSNNSSMSSPLSLVGKGANLQASPIQGPKVLQFPRINFSSTL